MKYLPRGGDTQRFILKQSNEAGGGEPPARGHIVRATACILYYYQILKGGNIMLSALLHLFENLPLLFALHFDGRTVFPPPLSAAEERACFEKMAQGDKAAREKLITHNLRLVAHIIKKYYSTAAEQDDLISIGTMGLIKAVNTFDHTKGLRFAAYGSRCVENEVLMHLRALKKTASDLSLDEPAQTDKDGNSLSLSDLLSDGVDVGDRVELIIETADLREKILSMPDKRQRQIIILRYGLGGGPPLTQREVAQRLKISRSYVSRIEKSALEYLSKK